MRDEKNVRENVQQNGTRKNQNQKSLMELLVARGEASQLEITTATG
jgi:hypothetical protein